MIHCVSLFLLSVVAFRGSCESRIAQLDNFCRFWSSTVRKYRQKRACAAMVTNTEKSKVLFRFSPLDGQHTCFDLWGHGIKDKEHLKKLSATFQSAHSTSCF